MIHVLPDPNAVADHAADLLAEALPSAQNLVLAGGGTPAATYRALCERDVDWDRLDLWLGDERWVPHDHPDSNLAMARRELAVGRHRILPMPWADDLRPDQAARLYADLLASRSLDGIVRPGIVLLGIGDDGHTASLFPGTTALDSTDDVAATFVHEKGTWRLTLTFPTLARAESVVFLVCGAGKASVLAELVEGDGTLPAARVADTARQVLWVVDEAAASALDSAEVVRP